MAAPTPAKEAPVWSRDYYFGRTDENSASPLPPPNLTPWLSGKQVGENNADARDQYMKDLRSNYSPGYNGEMAYRGRLASTPEVGNLHFTGMGVDWSQQRTSGTRYDEADNWGKTAPDPGLIGKEYGAADALRNSEPVPAGMVVNPYWKLPGQQPFITQEAYDQLAAEGLVQGQGPRPRATVDDTGQLRYQPLPDAYDATVLTAMRKGETNAEALGYDPSAPFQRENDYYAALKMRNDLSNATAGGYKTTRMPDGTFQIVGLTGPDGRALSPDELGNQRSYIIGSPPYGQNKPGQNATVTQDPLNYLFSQEINRSQPRFMPGYEGSGAEPVFAPYGAKVQGSAIPSNIPTNDPGYTGPGSYADAVKRGATDPTLAGMYPPPAASTVPGGTGAAGLAASSPSGSPPAAATYSAPLPAPSPAVAPDVQAAANADGFYMGIPLADWRRSLDSLGPDERDAYLASNPLLAEKLLRGYWGGGVTDLKDPAIVGENGPEIISRRRGGQISINPMVPLPGGGVATTGTTANSGSPTLGSGYAPWWSQDVTNPRTGGAPAPAPAPGSPGDMSNPWSGKALQLPDTFWQMTPLDQQAYLERLAGDKYNPAYLGQMAQKYKLAGVSGWNNVTGY